MTAPVMLGGGQVRLDEVYLSGSTDQGPAVVGGLALLADDHGLTVVGPQPSSVRTMPWGRASTIACRQPAQLPDGRAAVVLEVNIDGNALRFFVPQAYLGPEGAGTLEDRLTALARIPAALPPPVAIGGSEPASGQMPPGVLPPGALPPATGGTLSVSQGPSAGQYVRAGKKRGNRKARVAVVLVVVLIAGAASAYVVRSHKGGSTSAGGTSRDVLSAAAANLAPGAVPGWKGVPGTIGGAIGALGFSQAKSGVPVSVSGSKAAASIAANFARCMKVPAPQADAALAVLGFVQGVAVPGQTALSSSPLFEDPSVAATSTESSVMVLGTSAEQKADVSVFGERNFAGCYSLFLTAVTPRLVGGATSKIPFAYASVHTTRLGSSVAAVSVQGFTETFYRKGRPSRGALFGNIDVVTAGRMIAVFETISSRSFPSAEATKLLAAVEQNVAGESS